MKVCYLLVVSVPVTVPVVVGGAVVVLRVVVEGELAVLVVVDVLVPVGTPIKQIHQI